MKSHADSFQAIMSKPSVESNPKLNKKFMKKRKQIFQSLNMRKPHKTIPFQNTQLTPSPSPEKHLTSAEKLQLPDIYLYSRPKQPQIIPIEDNDKIVKQISKSLNFINKKIPVLNFDFLSIFDQNAKSIPYESQVYKKELQIMNMIFGSCGINLKPRDLMVLEGQKSKSHYIIFTNQPKHPQSLCCKSEIVIKHVQFLSPKNLYFAKDKSFEIPLKAFIALSLMKVRPSENKTTGLDHPVNEFQAQKRMLNYSKLISSGRFKKALINDESVELMKGRKSPLKRSKTRIQKLPQNYEPLKENNARYTEYEREIRVKSYQESMNLNKKLRSNQLQASINKRKHNISQIFVRKNV